MSSSIRIQAQDFDKRLLIQKPVISQNDIGEEIIVWTDVQTVWASIYPIKGSEAVRANQVLAEMDTRIGIRNPAFRDEMNAKWRATYKNRIYNFVSIANLESRNEAVEIMAKSGLNNG